MKKRLYIIGMAVVTMFASCQKDADVVDSATLDRAVTFYAESISPLTRVNGSSWEAGDEVGITMAQYNLDTEETTVIYDNIKYITSEGGTTVSFTPDSETIFFPEDDSQMILFEVFYPYHEEWSGNEVKTSDVSAQDGTQEAQNRVDVLRAVSTLETSGEQLLYFFHSLSKVQITVSNYNTISTFENLDDLTATITTRRGSYDYVTYSAISGDETELKMVRTSDGDDVIFTAIIVPGEVNDVVTFTDGTYSYSAEIYIEEAMSDNQYNFTATVGDQGFTLMEFTADGVTSWDGQTDVVLDTDLDFVDGVYEIHTAKGLKMFANIVNSGSTSIDGKLMDNIDLEGSEDNQWTPIGNESNKYSGTFDGGGFEVSGLYINQSTTSSTGCYQALFGYIDCATIKNLGISGSVTGYNYIGGIVGYGCSQSTVAAIENCYNKASISGVSYVGGIVGKCYSYDNIRPTTIINCYNTGAIKGMSTNSEYIGGVIGDSTCSIVNNCYNTGSVSNGKYIGGVVGDSSMSSMVNNCYNSAAVSGTDYIGGVVGNNSATVTSCYYDSTRYSGSGIGNGTGDATGYSTDYMQGENLIIRLTNAAYTYNEASPEIKAYGWKAGEDSYPVFDTESDPTYTTIDIEYYSADDLYLIYTAAGLTEFANSVNNGNSSIDGKLMKDIKLNGAWTPIGTGEYEDVAYAGVFDGDGYSVTGLYIDATTTYQGLFGSVVSGTLKNLSVGGEVTSSTGTCGIIVGYCKHATLTSCTALDGSSVSSSSDNNIAGISGYAYNTTFTDCHNHASLSGTRYIGGIVGYCNPAYLVSFTNCSNTGVIYSSSNNFAGGIAGKIFGTSSVVHTITNCFNSGSISSSGQYVGGLAGANQGGAIYNSYNLGEVYSTSSNVGGLAGIIESNSETSGSETIYTYAKIENCYTSAKVTGVSSAGLVVGVCSGATITSCYYDSSQSGDAIGADNDSQSITAYESLSTLLTDLNSAASGNDSYATWVAGDDSYPTFE